MTFQTNIDDIVNRDDLSVYQKQKELDVLLSMYKSKIEIVKEELVKDYMFCPKCHDHYKKTAWETGVRTVERTRCKNPLTGGYLGDYEYETVQETEIYYECTKGHKIVDYYGC